MTAILDELRRLDQQLSRGELSHDEFILRRAAVLQSVEEAETDFEPTQTRSVVSDRPNGLGAVGFSIVVCLGIMGLSIALILLLLPDLNLALTVGVTILAALTVALLRHSDD